LSDLYKEFTQERPLFELFNCIVDLEYNTNQLMNLGSTEEIAKEREQDENANSDLQNGAISGYVPKTGLFENFEA
jgi:hypothetical protein